ncbi:hypothetical protein FB451DRAFT_1269008 [Mycena latifolia]|nr:hypothetical protein FB451DRAFT_1269008 [Mycena latifolia]
MARIPDGAGGLLAPHYPTSAACDSGNAARPRRHHALLPQLRGLRRCLVRLVRRTGCAPHLPHPLRIGPRRVRRRRERAILRCGTGRADGGRYSRHCRGAVWRNGEGHRIASTPPESLQRAQEWKAGLTRSISVDPTRTPRPQHSRPTTSASASTFRHVCTTSARPQMAPSPPGSGGQGPEYDYASRRTDYDRRGSCGARIGQKNSIVKETRNHSFVYVPIVYNHVFSWA